MGILLICLTPFASTAPSQSPEILQRECRLRKEFLKMLLSEDCNTLSDRKHLTCPFQQPLDMTDRALHRPPMEAFHHPMFNTHQMAEARRPATANKMQKMQGCRSESGQKMERMPSSRTASAQKAGQIPTYRPVSEQKVGRMPAYRPVSGQKVEFLSTYSLI